MAKTIVIDAMVNPLERSSERSEKVYRKVTLPYAVHLRGLVSQLPRSLEHQLRRFTSSMAWA